LQRSSLTIASAVAGLRAMPIDATSIATANYIVKTKKIKKIKIKTGLCDAYRRH
jgi:hypothetical protein